MGRKHPLTPVGRACARLATLVLALSLFGGSSLSPNLYAAASRQGDARAAAGTCASPRPLALNDSAAAAPSGWFKFSVQKGQRYRLSAGSAAGLRLALHASCGDAPSYAVPAGKMEFTANRSGDFFLQADGASAGAAPLSLSLASAAPHRPNRAALAQVPEGVQRRAIEFLEEMRGSQDLAPEWANARVNPEARILYRPDITGPAYYEFNVEKPGANGFEPAGFIQLAAGEHDFPVTHWDTTGRSPVGELSELAPLGANLTEFYKLDALAYAAEYEQVIIPLGISVAADNVVNLGDLPGRINGLDGIPQQAAELVTASVDSDGKTQHDGPTELPLSSQEDWPSWTALKEQYKAEYAPLLASLQQKASTPWTLEKGLETNGESLIKGDVRVAYGLPSQTIASFKVTGEGAAAQFLRSEAVSDGTKTTGVRLTVLDGPSDRVTRLPFQVELTYAGGATDTIRYAIINSALASSNTVYLPLVLNAAGAGAASAAKVHLAPAGPAAAAPSDWGPWSYWWADGDAGSIRYGQFDYRGCASGCGGTAWAMLFAWVDRRAAEGHFRWAGHGGLYRANGSVGGANVTAPLAQDTGVQNITREIRDQIGTFCIFGSGATWPWRMVDAANYVRPRATAAWRINTRYDPTGLCWFGACDGSRDLAKDQIISYRAPAIVGTGWLKHYPLAFGYAERSKRSCFLFICSTSYSRWFYVNNGWYGNNNGWTSADVWFAGVYRP